MRKSGFLTLCWKHGNINNQNYFRMFHDAGPTFFVTVVNILSALIIIIDNLSSKMSKII